MSISREPDPALARKNRGMLLLLVAVFFGGMLLAGLLRFSGWRPEGMKNRGELLDPYGDLREYTPTLADGSPYRWRADERTWRMVVVPQDCDGARAQACLALLQSLDKVWRLMGRDADRVHLLWAGAVPQGAALPREVRVIRADHALRAGLPRWEVDRGAGEPVWLVDPNGFVFMRYAPGFDPADLRTDLSRMLKIN